MKKKGFDLKRFAWITRGRISTLTTEKFCEILDRLPLDFEFKLSNISEETDGHWIKECFRENEPESEKSDLIWHNLTNDRYCSSASFFSIKNKVIDAIHRKGAFLTYYKIKHNWHTLHQVLIGEKITNKLIKEELKKLYYEQSKSLEDIAKKYGRSRVYISRIMKKYGLERRTQSEARIEAIKKGKFERFEYDDINENFFIGWSPGMAWILGLLFTDGSIDNTRVAINSVDIELLEKIKKLLNSSKPIQKRTQSYDKSKHIYGFTFFREKNEGRFK